MVKKKLQLLQIVYSGLGGTSSVAFSLIESSLKLKKNIKNSILFLGVEKLINSFPKYCRNLEINLYKY